MLKLNQTIKMPGFSITRAKTTAIMEVDSVENITDNSVPSDRDADTSLTKTVPENVESNIRRNNINYTDLALKQETFSNEKDASLNNVDSIAENQSINETKVPIVNTEIESNENRTKDNELGGSEVVELPKEISNSKLEEGKIVGPILDENESEHTNTDILKPLSDNNVSEKDLSVDKNDTGIGNNSVQEEAPALKESSEQEEAPGQKGVLEKERIPLQEETPLQKETPIQEETSLQIETPLQEETPLQKESPSPEETPAQQEPVTNNEIDHKKELDNVNDLKEQATKDVTDEVHQNEDTQLTNITALKNEQDDSGTVNAEADLSNISTATTSTMDPNTPSTSFETKSSETTDDQQAKTNHISVKSNFEFAQVNFDATTQDNEKADERGAASGKSTELDPIASTSDAMDTLENCEGVDEEVIIIPDSEREITEAEKEAASTLPLLKDLSDKTTTEPAIPETESVVQNDIKIYNYNNKEAKHICCECNLEKSVIYHFSTENEEIKYFCDEKCLSNFKSKATKKITMVNDEGGGLRVKNFDGSNSLMEDTNEFTRKCALCNKVTNDIETNLTWEIMDFCNEFCLAKYQKMIGSKCVCCNQEVKATSLGKYCVRFGNDIRQFCGSMCLENYKKGLKICSYCQKDMSQSTEGYLAPVGEKRQFKDFCSRLCLDKYDVMTTDKLPKVQPGTICSVCKTEKPITIDYEFENVRQYFCGEPCFVAFAYVNKISPGKCAMCRRQFSSAVLEKHRMYYDNVQYTFCSNSCENIYIIAHRKIVPCSWCKVKKYNFDMIKKYSKTSRMVNMCSINCLHLYQVSLNAVTSKLLSCNYCLKFAPPAYHLTMSDATIRNFCTFSCVSNFQVQHSKLNKSTSLNEPIPMGVPQKIKKATFTIDTGNNLSSDGEPPLPVITHVQSLANSKDANLSSTLMPIPSTRLTRSKATSTSLVQTVQNAETPVQVQVKQYVMVKEKPSVEQRNVAVMCSSKKSVKATQTLPSKADIGIQTDKEDMKKMIIPIPIPIYVPAPCHMFSAPVPVPVPFPLPIPIPIFIPTTRNSAAGILKEIKKIQVKIPTDPYEAELLMMAEMVAEEKKEDNTDSESDVDDNTAETHDYSPEPVDTNNSFGDDMLQMALKMATELDEPAVDLEGALTANTITTPQTAHQDNHAPEEHVDDPAPLHHVMDNSADSRLKRRKRGMRGGARGGHSKRGRRMSHTQEIPILPVPPPPPPEPQEKPDANMCLKFTFGVNAWKQWVTTKNAELEKSSRVSKLFKTEILQLTADELNYSLCLFVKEVRKPNGQEYAPDTIYYLCLGIQQYLFENGRIDNIFCDMYYEKFTDCLDEVARKFSVLYNDSQYIVTRVEEEHLWESKQLGAHSPHVLLSTLMFFNTKHFNLTSVEEHMQLSFSHIMKHWKRNPNQPGASKVPGSRNVLLRFYPPQSAIQNNRKKKVYEQQENEENPLRCPVKLYEFYVSKCPESVKTRNDVFYLQPERSCVPDSPVWYSTMPLPKEALQKMLHRVKMVKEINVALLTS